jgi:hypothetical protein
MQMKFLFIAALCVCVCVCVAASQHRKYASAATPRQTFGIRGHDKRDARQNHIYYNILILP